MIHIASNLELWENKFSSVVVGQNPLPDAEWSRFSQLLEDWIVSIDEAAALVGSYQPEGSPGERYTRTQSAQGICQLFTLCSITANIFHCRQTYEEVMARIQEWLSFATNSIDSEDGKLVEQVSSPDVYTIAFHNTDLLA